MTIGVWARYVLFIFNMATEAQLRYWESLKGKPTWNKGKKGLQISWLKGKKMTEEQCNQMSIVRKGKKRDPKAVEKSIDTKKLNGYRHSNETKLKMSIKARKGKNSNFWINGNSKLKELIRQCSLYKQWRMEIYTRDHFRCQSCGIIGTYLEAHHIKSFSKILKENNITLIEQAEKCNELWDINNGVTLCKDCHKQTDNYLKRTIV